MIDQQLVFIENEEDSGNQMDDRFHVVHLFQEEFFFRRRVII